MNLRRSWRRFNQSIKFIWKHPLVKVERFRALHRYFSFHILTRINNIEKPIAFISGTQILIKRDLSGVATNYFTYLADFEEMSFLLHFLKPEDIFYDIGSNVGVWTILASGVIGCQTISIEPTKGAHAQLLKNINLNEINQKVITYNIALGKDEKLVHISTTKGALNRILSKKEDMSEVVKQKTLDMINEVVVPKLIKIDVEGYEMHVLNGGANILSDQRLQVIIIELNGSSKKYGFSDDEIHQKIINYNFIPVFYYPFRRELVELNNYDNRRHNTIYVRNLNMARTILYAAQKLNIGGYNF